MPMNIPAWWWRAMVAASLLLQPLREIPLQDLQYAPVSREVIVERLEKYKGNDQQREKTLKQLFTGAGCEDAHLSEQQVKGSRLPNVVCVLPGGTDRAILVGAHFDHISEGDGVVDNWSSAALLPSLFEVMKAEPRTHTYIFIGFTDEEKGEVGSRFYARQMTSEQVAATDAMVNMDTLGLAPAEVWASHSDKQLVNKLAYAANKLGVPLSGVNVERIGSTDSVQFSERKIPSITIHSLTQETFNARILHTSKDRLSAMKLNDYYQTYSLLSAYLVFLDKHTGTVASVAPR
jgi:putative aminopeptidase FrvX